MVAVTSTGRIIGSAIGFDQHPAPITFGMHVAIDQRRHGVGTALLQSVLAWAGERGSHKVVLEVWPHNHAAIRTPCRALGSRVPGSPVRVPLLRVYRAMDNLRSVWLSRPWR